MLYPLQNGVRNKVDVSGIWDFQPDPDAAGEQDGWINGLPDRRPVAVPESWNEQHADLFNYFGLAWHVTRVVVPRSWQGELVQRGRI